MILEKLFKFKTLYLIKLLFSFFSEIWLVHKKIEIRCIANKLFLLFYVVNILARLENGI